LPTTSHWPLASPASVVACSGGAATTVSQLTDLFVAGARAWTKPGTASGAACGAAVGARAYHRPGNGAPGPVGPPSTNAPCATSPIRRVPTQTGLYDHYSEVSVTLVLHQRSSAVTSATYPLAKDVIYHSASEAWKAIWQGGRRCRLRRAAAGLLRHAAQRVCRAATPAADSGDPDGNWLLRPSDES
jgi:hypothetical protein